MGDTVQTLDVKGMIDGFKSLNSMLNALATKITFDEAQLDLASKKLKSGANSFKSGGGSAGLEESVQTILDVYANGFSNIQSTVDHSASVEILTNGVKNINNFVNSVKTQLNSIPILDNDFLTHVPDSKEMMSLNSKLKTAQNAKVGDILAGARFSTEEEKQNAISAIGLEIDSLKNRGLDKGVSIQQRIDSISNVKSWMDLLNNGFSEIENIDTTHLLAAYEKMNTPIGDGKTIPEIITGTTAVLQLVSKALNSVKDYRAAVDTGGKAWEPIAFSLDGKPSMWAEVDVTTSMGLVSRLKTIPELFGNLKLFSKTMEEGLSGLDWLDNFQLRSSLRPLKPYKDKDGKWNSGAAEQITGTTAVLQLVSKALNKIPEYGAVSEGQKPVIARLNILRKRLPRDISALADLLIDIKDSQTGLDTVSKKLRLGSDFDTIESYKDREGNIISVETYNKIYSKSPYSALNEYTPNTKSTSSLVYIDLTANYVNSLVKSISKISSVPTKELRKTRRNINRLSKTVPDTLRDVAVMLRTIDSEVGSPDKIRSLIGWNEGSGGNEFVTYTDEINGVQYEKYLEVSSGDSWGGTEKVKNLKYIKPHYEAETSLFLIGDYVSKLVGSVDKITSLDPIAIRKKAIRFRMGIRPLVGMLRASVTELTKQLGKSTVDPSTIEFLMGSEQSEENYINIIQKGYSTNGENAHETAAEDRSVKRISNKKAGLLDVTGRVFEIIDRMVNFPFNDNIKKLLKFRVKAWILGKTVKGSVNALVGTVSTIKLGIGSSMSIGENASKEEIDKSLSDTTDTIIHFLGKEGIQGVFDLLVKVSDSYIQIANKVGGSKISRLILPKGVRNDSDVVTNFIDTCLRVVTHLSKNKKLSDSDFKKANDNAKAISGVFSSMIPAAMSFRALQMISVIGRNSTGERVKLLATNMVETANVFGDNKEKLVESKKGILQLVSVIGILAAALLLVIRPIGQDASEIGVGLATMGLVSFGSMKIFDKIADNIDTIKAGAQALLIISGSFVLFSLSILLLGQANKLTAEAIGGFIIIVAAAVGVFYLLTRAKKNTEIGTMVLIDIALTFLAFTGVIAVMSLMADRINFLGLLGMVGIIALMVGVGALAGLASGLLVAAGIGLGVLAIGIAAIVGSMALIVLLAHSIGDPNDTVKPFTDALAVLVTGLCNINPLQLIGSILIGIGLVVLMVEMLVVFSNLRLISKLALSSKENVELTQSINTAMQGIKTITNTIDSISGKKLAKSVAKTLAIKWMMFNLSGTMRLLSKIASRKVPVEWDRDGNVTKWEPLETTNVRSITATINTMVQGVDVIARELTKEGSLDAKTLRSAKRRARAMKNMMRHVSGMLKFIMSLTKGPIEYGETDENGELIKGTTGTIKGSLGDYLHSHKKQITDNVSTMMSIMNDIAVRLNEGNEDGRGMKDYTAGDMRSARRKTRNIARIVELLNPIIELIKSLSDGQYNVGTDEHPEMVNLGSFIDAKKPKIEENLDSLFNLVKHIGDRVLELNETDGGREKGWFERTFTPNRDIKTAGKRASLIGDTLGVISMTMGIINDLALGNIQVGTNPDGSPKMENMSEFLSKNESKIYANLSTLFGFITGDNGIQSKIEKLAGEKDKNAERKQNALDLISGVTDVISSILDMATRLGQSISDASTKDLFGSDKSINLSGRMNSLIDAYTVPLGDSSIFANASKFKIRFKNLTDYDKLMKRIIDIKSVSNYEKSVKATGDMVTSINSIDDVKIDKLNTLMKSMIKFGETMDDALKNVLDQVVDLSKELHYIIEYNENNPRQPKPAESTGTGIVPISTSAQTSSQTVAQNNKHEKANRGMSQMTAQKISGEVSTIEERLRKIEEYVSAISVSFADGVSKT